MLRGLGSRSKRRNATDTADDTTVAITRLAARHGIQVTLSASPYGGAIAKVVLPTAVLWQPSCPASAPAPPAAPAPAPVAAPVTATVMTNGTAVKAASVLARRVASGRTTGATEDASVGAVISTAADEKRSDAANLGGLVRSFMDRVPNVTRGVAVSPEGLPLAFAGAVDRDGADRYAAVAAGLLGLAEGATGAGRVRDVVVEMDDGFLFITRIADGSCLLVTTNRGCDAGLVGYELAVLVERCGEVLTPAPVRELQAAVAQ